MRDNKFLHETNINNGDTALWEIKWTGECTYSAKYISGNAKMTDEEHTLLQKHKFVYEILNVTGQYYIFKGYIDKISNIPIQTDTMWLNEKANIPNNELFKQLPNSLVLKRNHFSDTSKYAVIYIYRPGKFSNSQQNCLIYFDDNIMCVAKNRSGYIFKILKEGQFEIKSKFEKDESSVKLDVKFGNVYYVKSMIHWGIYSLNRNYKLEMAIVKPEDGKIEFQDVDLQ